jgi:hypothetical protein
VEFKPSRLFKWNDVEWIQVNKNVSDSYVNDPGYMAFLVEKLGNGEYDWEDLTQSEQDAVEQLTGNRG